MSGKINRNQGVLNECAPVRPAAKAEPVRTKEDAPHRIARILPALWSLSSLLYRRRELYVK